MQTTPAATRPLPLRPYLGVALMTVLVALLLSIAFWQAMGGR
jgi:hypothetical protein